MKKLIYFSLFLMLMTNVAFAQEPGMGMNPEKPELGLMGGIGAAWIENEDGEMEMWYNIQARPELAFGKFGLGLNIDLFYNPDPGEGEDNFRSEDLAFEKILWYLRYGHKGNKPVYARVGALDRAKLGHGFIVYHYNNQINEDNRKLGLAFDLNLEKFGMETITSDLGRLGILGFRPYVKPLKLANSNIPILSNLEVGASYVSDFDPDEWDETDGKVTAIGVDMGLPIIQNQLIDFQLYGDFAKLSATIDTLNENGEEGEEDIGGSGAALGASADFRGLGLITIGVKLERRFMGEEFLPSYFNALYEVNKEQKMYALKAVDESIQGTFGELSGHILQKFTLLGHYQYIDDIDESGILHLEADGSDIMPEKISVLNATYDKQGIETLEDAFTLDENSLAAVNVGYNINKYMALTVQYQWSFRWNEEEGKLDTIEKITPGITFNYNF